ncbi:MAG: hypothetical protein ACTS2F_28445 [Thainema sp.]
MTRLTRLPLLSFFLLLSAFFTFGWFLFRSEAPPAVWGLSAGFGLFEAAIFTFLWEPAQNFFLRHVQSDAGYTITILSLASLAVIAIVWIHITAYFLVLISSLLLARLDTLMLRMHSVQSFFCLWITSWIGLGLSAIVTLQLHWLS